MNNGIDRSADPFQKQYKSGDKSDGFVRSHQQSDEKHEGARYRLELPVRMTEDDIVALFGRPASRASTIRIVAPLKRPLLLEPQFGAMLLELAVQLRIKVGAFSELVFLLLDSNSVRLGIGILAYTGYLP